MNSFFGHMGGWGPTAFFGLGALGMTIGILFIIVILVLKGFALWHAAKRDEKWWFIVILVLNTVGILELIYLIFIVKKWPQIYSGNSTSNQGGTSTSGSTSDSSKPLIDNSSTGVSAGSKNQP